MKYPDYKTYQKLYGRYLQKGPERFFVKCDPSGKHILDLCCGGGQLTQYALDNGASYVYMVDLSLQMINPEFKGYGRTSKIECAVEEFLPLNSHEKRFDIIVSRQAVNYWLKNVDAKDIADALVPGGMFVFNTFGNKPTETPMVREYYHRGCKYREVSFMFQNKVHHVQCCDEMEPHMTVFDWIDRQEYVDRLSPYFDCEEVIEGPSSMWHCKRK
jgi:SAM-dependent methyltransferase